ncbi:MAG: O-antigen ligase family protein [Bacilli bacterium]|nr:O-antigen ligase family protein [Bacilli bacterium]
MKQKRFINLIYILFLIFPILDVVTALIERLQIHIISPGILVKVLFISILMIYILFFSKSKYRKISIIYLFTIGIYGILYLITKQGIWHTSFLIKEANMFFKFFYYPLTFTGLLNVFDDNKISKNKIYAILIYTLLCYILFLIIPMLTKTGFNTYDNPNLAGNIGWFYSANEVSAVIMMLLPFAFLFINNDKKYKWLYLSIFIIVYGILSIGTKVTLLGVIVTSIILFIVDNLKHRKIKSIHNYAYLSIFFFIIMFSMLTPALNNIEKKANDEIEIMCYMPDDEEKLKIYDFKYYKLLNMALSGRELKAERMYNIYKKTSFNEKLFGIGFSNRDIINNHFISYTVEMDPVDILFHYGIVGFIIIIMPILYCLFSVLKYIIKNRKDNFELVKHLMIILLTLGISLLAGHVLSSPAVSIYLSLYLVLIFAEIGKIEFVNNKDYNIVHNSKKVVSMIKKYYKKYQEIINYLVVGGLTTVVSILSYYICVHTFLDATHATELQIANIISWICAVLFAYVTNRIFVFKSKNNNKLKEFTSFVSARVLTLLMDMVIMYICVTLMQMNDLVAKLIVQVVVTIANYVFSKIFVFKK